MRQRFQSGERVYEVEVERRGESYQAKIDGQAFEFEVLDMQPGLISLRVQGKPAAIYWAADEGVKWLSMSGCTYRLEKPKPAAMHASGEITGAESIRSPMPAQVRAVQVQIGQEVEKGETLLLLEAMKMEIRVRAPAAGRVTRLMVEEGQSVIKEQMLLEMED
jgi:acetyl/propionyl-CoA carboxylase alpha subunit